MTTLITTQRVYRLDEPLTVYSDVTKNIRAEDAGEYRYVSRTIRVTWKPDVPIAVEMSGPDQQVHRYGEYRSVGRIGGYYPVPTDQHPDWLDKGYQ